MRIADNMMFDQVRGNVSRNRTEMSDLQNQAATQKRVTKPSDDPIAAARVLGSRVDLEGNKQYLKNLDYAKSFLEFSDQSLGELTDMLVRAKELAIYQANDAGANEKSRRVTAAEIDQIFNQTVSVGNRKLGDRFIFGGFVTTSPPFTSDGEYSGDEGEMLINTDKSQYMAMNIPGNKVFFGEGLQTPTGKPQEEGQSEGLNIFQAVRGLSIALETNDKAGVQDSLEDLDSAISQVVTARAQVGSRVTALNNLFESLQKSKVDDQVAISQQQDADVFQVVSDINKNQSTLEATLQTSGKIIQKSLMDFLR